MTYKFDETHLAKDISVTEIANALGVGTVVAARVKGMLDTVDAAARAEGVASYLKIVDSLLDKVYDEIITESWEHSSTFDAYQDAWRRVAKVFSVKPFDYTKGERVYSVAIRTRTEHDRSIPS